MGLEMEFDKKCRVGLSPTTVLPLNRRFSNVENRTRRSKFTLRDELLTIDENFTEISFGRYRSASCKNVSSRPSCMEGNAETVTKRGSVYRTSNEVREMKKLGVFEERREKIEISHSIDEESSKKKRSSVKSRSSRLSQNSISESLMVQFSSDEFFEIRLNGNGSVERASSVDQSMKCSEVFGPQNDGNEPLEVLPKSLSSKTIQNHKFNPIRKMFDPFTKSKSLKSPLGFIDSEPKVEPKSQRVKKISHDSVSAYSPVHLNGRLKVEKKHGAPFFEFSLKSPDEVFVAKTRKVENSFYWVYSFYSSSCRSKVEESSSMVGQMKVSCYLNSEQSDEAFYSSVMVTEFVLYDIAYKRKSCAYQERCEFSEVDLQPIDEIAAIVIEAPFEKRESLKNENNVAKMNGTPMKVVQPTKMNVVIPSGIHGFVPNEENHGPSCLLDRWRLNGGCECGGWDMACPLTVFSDLSIQSGDDRSNPWPHKIYAEGSKEKVPALTITATEEGNYTIDFHAQLSTLQAFSICVAILHNSDPSTVIKHEENKHLLQCNSLKELLNEEAKFLFIDEDKKETLSSFVPNPPFSPISRV